MRLAWLCATSPGVPAATMRPPSSPVPGPMSMIQSLRDDLHVMLDHDHGIA